MDRPKAARQLTVMVLLFVLPSLGKELPKGLATVEGIAIVSIQDFLDGRVPPRRLLQVQLDSGATIFASQGSSSAAASQMDRVRTGQRVRMTGHLPRSSFKLGGSGAAAMDVTSIVPLSQLPTRAPRAVGSIKLKSRGDSLPVYTFDPLVRTFKALLVLVEGRDSMGNVCSGLTPTPYTRKDVLTSLQSGTDPGNRTLSDTFHDCSMGRTPLDWASSAVTDFVTIPCSGRTKLGSWSLTSCNQDERESWFTVIDPLVALQGYNTSQYDSLIYLLPPVQPACSWSGIGRQGCIGQDNILCRVWMFGYNGIAGRETFWKTFIPFHEVGHNFVVDGQWREYGDQTATMGGGGKWAPLPNGQSEFLILRCHNTPHAWQLGWLSVVQITSAELPPGKTVELQLLPRSNAASKGVRVLPDWTGNSITAFFIGYRDTAGSDFELLPVYAFKTSIYIANITRPNASWADSTTLYLSSIDGASQVYKDQASGLTFRHLGGGGPGSEFANVSICREAGNETLASCCAGQDNDCNGQAGVDDPGCDALMPQCCQPQGPETLASCCGGVLDSDCNGKVGTADPGCAALMPKCSTFKNYTLLVTTFTLASSCSAFEASKATIQAWKQAVPAALAPATGLLGAVDLACQEGRKVKGGLLRRLRVTVRASTERMTLQSAKALGLRLAKAARSRRLGREVRALQGSKAMLPARSGGWCVEGQTTCPPAQYP